MELIVGTDSTWSLRSWICSQLAGVPVNVKIIDLANRNYKPEILKYSPAGLVPILNTGSFFIHDSMAIAEYLNELSNGALYPKTQPERALSRSLCAELHSGFINIRTHYSFSLDAVKRPEKISHKTQIEISRICSIFEKAQLPFMFESVGIVDAFYSIMAYRLNSYGISLEGKAEDYHQSLLNWSILKKSIELATSWKSKY